MTTPPIRYTVRIQSPSSHYAEVEARFPATGGEFEVFLPVWTPGSYKIREYARHIENFTAQDSGGNLLVFQKTRKNRWTIILQEAVDEIIVRYSLYCHELSVRTNWIDDQFALLVGAATFITAPALLGNRHEVTVELPVGWRDVWCGLEREGNRFVAPGYDLLVDSPIVAGNAAMSGFEVDGKPHTLIHVGDAGLWDEPTIAGDVQRLVAENRAFWGALPYSKYLFLNLLTGSGGGLEHANSMVIMADRYAARTRTSYLAWLGLVSHEFFHVWNVKRLRPVELGPFDYENEVYTRNLWIAEGFTHYYEALLVRRAGISTDAEFLGTTLPARQRGIALSLTGLIEELQTTPGRLRQPVSQASFDAWIKQYHPDENSPNSAISYYTKGAVIAWLLDAQIREATADTKSLDDAMRLSFVRYSGSRGFTEDEFLSLIQEVGRLDLRTWLGHVLNTTAELDYSQALRWFGLRFRTPAPVPGTPAKAWTGATTKTEGGRLVITKVLRDSPASRAGLSAHDEILGLNGFRVTSDQWDKRMEQYREGDRIALLIARMERLLTVEVELGSEPAREWIVEVDPQATPEQKAHFSSWLKSSKDCGGVYCSGL